MTSTTTPKKLLYEVSIIRPTIIFLLVVLHSFTLLAQGDENIDDYQLNTVYQWFVWLIYGFRIETIALVAGYVFAYQSIDLKRSYRFGPFVWKKFKRLIIPMLVFGLVYYFCFEFKTASFSVKTFLVKWFSGCGHLWFLPMLFECFLAIWIIDRFKLSSWLTLFVLAAITLFPTPAYLPFGLGKLPHFLFFVYAGYFLWTKRDWLFQHCLNHTTICILWMFYVLFVVLVHTALPSATPEMNIVQKGLVLLLNHSVKLLMSCCGIMALYLTVCKITTKEGYRPKQWVIEASDNCYGVYVYHQFILVFLYFYTPLVSVCHPYLVPWIGLVVTLLVSLLLTKLTLKTKPGRFLIG